MIKKREEEIIQTISEALPSMGEFGKGYFVGYAEALAEKKRKEKESMEPEKKGA